MTAVFLCIDCKTGAVNRYVGNKHGHGPVFLRGADDKPSVYWAASYELLELFRRQPDLCRQSEPPA